VLDYVVGEPVREDLAWQRRYRDSGTFSLEDIAEVLEVGISSADHGVAQLERWDVGSSVYLVRSVHVPW